MIQDQTAHVGMPAAGLPSALIMLLFAAYLLCTEVGEGGLHHAV